MKPFVCSICQCTIVEQYGNNAWPINEGRCCDNCDQLVIAARINQIVEERRKKILSAS
jgi:hypothetical protein